MGVIERTDNKMTVIKLLEGIMLIEETEDLEGIMEIEETEDLEGIMIKEDLEGIMKKEDLEGIMKTEETEETEEIEEGEVAEGATQHKLGETDRSVMPVALAVPKMVRRRSRQ